jgi:hypothetical protein
VSAHELAALHIGAFVLGDSQALADSRCFTGAVLLVLGAWLCLRGFRAQAKG